MDFVDWCGQVLNAITNAVKESSQSRLMGVNEIDLAKTIFGEERRIQSSFWESTQRHGMLDAVSQLEKLGLVEDRGHRFYLPTASGRAVIKDPKSLWLRICSSVELDGEHIELLNAVNLLSPKTADDHAWLESIDNEPLLTQLHWPGGDEGRDLLWAVSQEIAQHELVKRDAWMGGRIYLTSTYQGLVWETKRSLLQKCDVFISHSTDEKALAVEMQAFLKRAFGEDFRVFVSSDYRSIGGGSLWFIELLEAIKTAPVTLALLSGSSVERRWINFEAGIGVGADRLVIPLVVPGLSKNEVGHPLSMLQVRSLADEKDVEGVISDIEERTKRSAASVDAKAFVSKGYSTGGGKLEATLHQVTERAYEGYEEHGLRIVLVNNSSKTIDDFRVDIEIPNAFINQSTTYAAEVENRRTASYRVFRADGKRHNIQKLHPGDRVPNFFITTLIIPPGAAEGDALDQRIVVKVYADDIMTQRIEKTVREVLEMPPSFI